MKTYDHVLIDWDGNLVKTLDVWLDAYKEVLNTHGHILSDQEIGRSFGDPLKLLGRLGIESVEQGMAQIAILASAQLPQAELYPGAIELLERLDQTGKRKALITSSDEIYIKGNFERHGLGKYFMSVVTGDKVQHRKPHTEPLIRAMIDIAASPEHTIIIGDSESDIIPANALGIDSILFFPPEHNRFYDIGHLMLHKPTYTAESLEEVAEIIK